MNKKTLAALMFASLSTMMTAQAITIDPAAQTIINTAKAANINMDTALTNAINSTTDAALVESLLAAAIAEVGADSEEAKTILETVLNAVGEKSNLIIASLLSVATESGMASTNVIDVAATNGIDLTLASEATATGTAGTDNGITFATVDGKTTFSSGGGTGYTNS